MVSLLSEKQNANDFYTQKQNLACVDLDYPYELTGQILDDLFSRFIIRKLTSLSVNYKLIGV